MTYAELFTALQIFGFSEHDLLTMSQVRRRHRELVKSHHPDLRGNSSSTAMSRINAASALLMNYLQSYRFSFSEDEFYRQNPDERLRMQFAEDPVWGGSCDTRES
jgi:hypothetical protein